jgi:hypothetical protein
MTRPSTKSELRVYASIQAIHSSTGPKSQGNEKARKLMEDCKSDIIEL